MDTKTIIIIGIIVFIVILFIVYDKKHEGFDDFDDINCSYTEANLACNLGAKKCHFSNGSYNGKKGLCNPTTRLCEYMPQWTNTKNGYPLMYPPANFPPIGEANNPDCLFRQICVRNDGKMGACMSGLCYPETQLVD